MLMTLLAAGLALGPRWIGDNNEIEIDTKRDGDGVNYPQAGKTVQVHYTGILKENRKKFDSSLDRNEPFSFRLGVGQVITCWDKAVARMSQGEVADVTCPAHTAYGGRRAGMIPPDSDLIFTIEVIKV